LEFWSLAAGSLLHAPGEGDGSTEAKKFPGARVRMILLWIRLRKIPALCCSIQVNIQEGAANEFIIALSCRVLMKL
jgi:hypothetical protein